MVHVDATDRPPRSATIASVDEPEHDDAVIAILRHRDGQETTVVLNDGRELSLLNIAWGYDDGVVSAHVTTNISPSEDGRAIDVFLTRDVLAILDTRTGQTLFTTVD
jgi:hypothetical protein